MALTRRRTKTPFDLGILIDMPHPLTAGDDAWPEWTYAHLCYDRYPNDPTIGLLPVHRVNVSYDQADIWSYDNDARRWINEQSSIPPIIYNRISRRRIENSRTGQRLLSKLKKKHIVFNPGFLNKHNVYEQLQRRGLQTIMPPFTTTESVNQAMQFYRRHRDVYIKPSSGSLGRGIARLVRRTNDRHELFVCNRKVSLPARRFLNDDQVHRWFHRLSLREMYVLQKTIPLVTWNDRSVDVRALLQKDAAKTWRLTGASGRAAPQGALTTHTTRGGERLSLTRLLQKHPFLAPALQRIETTCRRAAYALDDGNDLWAEFSFDLALSRPPYDTSTPFILEVNAKPFPFDETNIRKRASRNFMRFVRSLLQSPQRASR